MPEEETSKKKSTNTFCAFLHGYLFAKFSVYYVLIIIYLLLGGLIFHLIEGANEQVVRNQATLEIENLNTNIKSFLMSVNISNRTISNQQLSLFTSYTIELTRNLSSLYSIVDQNPKWTYGRSVYFSFIAITTIGYGQLAPTTHLGQALLCIYAFLGIPLLIFLIAQTSTKLTGAFDRLVLRRFKKEFVRWLAIVIALIIVVVSMILIPAVIFGHIEGWAYATATYFCFVSLSTIGFGDFVLGANPSAPYDRDPAARELYVLSSLIWLYLGLVLIAILIGQIGTGIEKIENQVSEFFEKLMKRKLGIVEEVVVEEAVKGSAYTKRRDTNLALLSN